ncbi:hypothetical protein ACH5RR_019637 [Cinchona calisaya]|uniref:LysM domain-containing protein n=1 Tax=Cinchona calisaya TaxID=153742 RepID=A0ABD2ZQE3_9GENT
MILCNMASLVSKSRCKSSMVLGSSRGSFIVLVTIMILLLMSPTTKASPPIIDQKEVMLINQPCDELYVVSEGETLHSISAKCDDPFILERNPHIYDPDDVFPGLVLLILPSSSRKL